MTWERVTCNQHFQPCLNWFLDRNKSKNHPLSLKVDSWQRIVVHNDNVFWLDLVLLDFCLTLAIDRPIVCTSFRIALWNLIVNLSFWRVSSIEREFPTIPNLSRAAEFILAFVCFCFSEGGGGRVCVAQSVIFHVVCSVLWTIMCLLVFYCLFM